MDAPIRPRTMKQQQQYFSTYCKDKTHWKCSGTRWTSTMKARRCACPCHLEKKETTLEAVERIHGSAR